MEEYRMRDVVMTFKAPASTTDEAFKEKIAAHLYKDGVLSAYQARLIVGSTRRDFEDILAKHGVAIADLEDSDDFDD